MSQWIATQHASWMRLDPPKQLMFWSVVGAMVPGVFVVLMAFFVPAMVHDGSVASDMFWIGLGGLGFIAVFLTAILFLTVVWPHHYQKYQATSRRHASASPQ